MREIDNNEDFEEWNKNPSEPVAVQEVNLLRYDDEQFKNKSYEGCLFLGCELHHGATGYIVQRGGVVIPRSKEVTFPVHKAKLYTVPEIFEGFDPNSPTGYESTYDFKIYKEYYHHGMEYPDSIAVSLARRLHDHSITDALHEMIDGRKVVAIMGGHAMERQDPYYLRIARISRALTNAGYLMVSGGGPGAMEATHFGAYFACRPESEMVEALDQMKIRQPGAPRGKEYDDPDWLHRAWKILDKYPILEGKEDASASIGIPTWLYGHEPPAAFATHIAKYFANSVREEGLLAIAKHGVIFAPGSAGTTQEIFQDATQNHYATYNKNRFGQPVKKKFVSPMILFGEKRWTVERPLWDFLRIAASGRKYGELLWLTESEDEVIERILKYDPEKYTFPPNS